MIEVGVSIGAAVFPADGEDPDLLIRHANAAMYEAKRQSQRAGGTSALRPPALPS